MTARKVLSEAMKLPPSERMGVARELLDSIDVDDEPDFELSPELERELDRISKEIDEHPERCIPFEQVEKELDELMRQDKRARK